MGYISFFAIATHPIHSLSASRNLKYAHHMMSR